MSQEFIKVNINTKGMNLVDVKMTITTGKLNSIVNALQANPTPVGQDVLLMIQNAMKTCCGL